MSIDTRFGQKTFSKETVNSRFSSVNDEMRIGKKTLIRGGKILSDKVDVKNIISLKIKSNEVETDKQTTDEITSKVSITDCHVLNPQSSEPLNPTNGTIWYNDNDNEIYIWMNGGKQRLKHENV